MELRLLKDEEETENDHTVAKLETGSPKAEPIEEPTGVKKAVCKPNNTEQVLSEEANNSVLL